MRTDHHKARRAGLIPTKIDSFPQEGYPFHQMDSLELYSSHSNAAAPRIAPRKPPGILKGTAPLDGADVVWDVTATEAVELMAELGDTLAPLLLAEAELDDADSELAEVEVADAELPDEPEADEAEAVPVDAINPVCVPVAPWTAK
jgi:hypothetical protein